MIIGCVHAYFAKAESAFWNGWFKTPIQNALHGSTVHASLEKKTTFREHALRIVRGYCSSSSEPERRFRVCLRRGYKWLALICSCLTRSKRTFLGCVQSTFLRSCWIQRLRKRWFKTADPKRPSREYCSCFPRRRRFREHALSMRAFRGYCSSSSDEPGKGRYMTSFKRGYMWFCVHDSSPESAFCSKPRS